MNKVKEIQEEVTIKFAGDSGDGMQLTGALFTDNTALTGSDLATFPDFPAEIRAPAGTLPGVSGFQIHFGSKKIFTPGDEYDVLVAMNAAALKTNLSRVKKGGTVIVNTEGFDVKNLRLAKYAANPLEDGSLQGYELYAIPITKLTREALADTSLGTKEKDRSKNMFVLGFLLWRYNRDVKSVERFLEAKFATKYEILRANLKVLRAGYHFGETTETFTTTYEVKPAPLPKGTYRSIMGNQALVLGLLAAANKSGLPLFYGSYPITPASDILHQLSTYRHLGVKTFQAEDEIAAICAAIGASYGGALAVTGTSGPGIALKSEAMGLAVMLELPLVVCDIQRGGPSTGLPTKTEQADLLQVMYGRNGESPMPVLAARSPSDAFEAAFEACRIALQHMTPVVLLSDGYIANGAEPWRFPKADELPEIPVHFAQAKASENGQPFLPYARDERQVRPWALPGTSGLAHRIGGLEKAHLTGDVSYDPDNHNLMVRLREEKVQRIAQFIPEQQITSGVEQGELLLLGWGSTFGVLESVTRTLLAEGHRVGHVHLRYLNPMPRNLGELMRRYDKVLVPELNRGQLAQLLRAKYLLPIVSFNSVRGVPISHNELLAFAREQLRQDAQVS